MPNPWMNNLAEKKTCEGKPEDGISTPNVSNKISILAYKNNFFLVNVIGDIAAWDVQKLSQRVGKSQEEKACNGMNLVEFGKRVH